MGEWNGRQYEAARRAWEASEQTDDMRTRKALERLSATYFWASLGMVGGDARTGDPAPPLTCRRGGAR